MQLFSTLKTPCQILPSNLQDALSNPFISERSNLYLTSSTNISLCGRHFSLIPAPNHASNILSLFLVVSMPSECLLANALAYEKVRSFRFRSCQPTRRGSKAGVSHGVRSRAAPHVMKKGDWPILYPLRTCFVKSQREVFRDPWDTNSVSHGRLTQSQEVYKCLPETYG